MSQAWNLQLLGRLGATRDERVVTRFPTRKTGLVLAMLALEPERPRTREMVIAEFWPDSEPAAGRNSLSRALSGLRRLLEAPDAAGSVLATDRYHVGLAPGSLKTDVQSLRAAWKAAEAADPKSPEQLALLHQAAEAYQGELLPGADGDWVVPEREALAGLHMRVLGRLVERLLHDGQAEEAIQVARRAVAADPLREPAHRDLMRALMAAGRKAEAARHFRALEELLHEELAVAPSEATRTLAATLRGVADEGPIAVPATAGLGSSEPRSSEVTPAATPAPRPSGTVTVLALRFTPDPDRSEDLPRFLRRLGRGLRALDGIVIQAGVEETLVLFGQASDAAAAAQLGLREAAQLGSVAVRAGLHTAEIADGEQAEHAPVAELARALSAIAHDGRIVLSEEAAILARPALEGDDRLVDLGRFELAGVDVPQRLFQLRREARAGVVEAEHAPVSITPTLTSRLPVRLSRFIGREEERDQILTLLEQPDARLVTITGIGGTGKTRLATEAAAAWESRTSATATWVALETISDSRHIGATVAEAMGLAVPEAYDALAMVRATIGDAPALLVLDNFEQLVDRGGLVVKELLMACPALRCLVTSRNRLGVEGERDFVLRPLPVPDLDAWTNSLSGVPSVQLFLDRARSTEPDFQLRPDNATDIARLCIALEGMPLAIELAAARIGVLDPGQMLARIKDRLQWLATRRTDLSERQRSLRGAFEWSYTQLAPEARSAFEAVSIFRGAWDLEAAESVLDDPLAVERMAELRDASLIGTQRGDDGIRFTMLEALRLFAHEKLAPERLKQLRAAHAAHFSQLASTAEPQLTGPEQRLWLERLARDDDNLSAALAWCAGEEGETAIGLSLVGDLAYYWFNRGYLRAGLEIAGRLLAKPEAQDDPAIEIRALRVAGGLAAFLEDHAVATPYLERALALQKESDDTWGIATTRYQLAVLAKGSGEHETARRYAEASVAGYEDLSGARAERGLAAANNMLGVLALEDEDLAAARRHLGRSLTLVETLGDAQAVKNVHDNLARTEILAGDLPRAAEHVREAARIALELGNEWGVLKAIRLQADVCLAAGEDECAAHLLGASEIHGRRLDPPHAAETAATHERMAETLRDRMGGAAFEAALTEGRAWAWERAVREVQGGGAEKGSDDEGGVDGV